MSVAVELSCSAEPAASLQEAPELELPDLDGACVGSGPALAWALVWLAFTVVVPVGLTRRWFTTNGGLVTDVIAYLMIGLGTAYVIAPLVARTLYGGLFCSPVEPPGRAEPFVPGTAGEKRQVRKIKVIVNPAGGRRKGPALLRQAQAVWAEEFDDIEVEVLRTEYAGHAREIARTTSLSAVDALCIVGGGVKPARAQA